jgi:hypothetical protein
MNTFTTRLAAISLFLNTLKGLLSPLGQNRRLNHHKALRQLQLRYKLPTKSLQRWGFSIRMELAGIADFHV